MNPISSVIEICFFALTYVLLIQFAQAFLHELVLPRLNFSKTSTINIKQMFVRWILIAKRFDFSMGRDIFAVLMVAILLTAVAILPLDGQLGLTVSRPDLAIALLLSMYYFARVIWGWKVNGAANWERALEEVMFAAPRAFIFLLLIDGAYLSLSPEYFQKLLGDDLIMLNSPFHFLAFLIGIVLVAFFQGRHEYRRDLRGLSLFAWKTESIFWTTLLLVTYFNTSNLTGLANMLLIAFKCTAILFILDLVRSHIPQARMDQLERIGLYLIYPVIIFVFLGMWWQEAIK